MYKNLKVCNRGTTFKQSAEMTYRKLDLVCVDKILGSISDLAQINKYVFGQPRPIYGISEK